MTWSGVEVEEWSGVEQKRVGMTPATAGPILIV